MVTSDPVAQVMFEELNQIYCDPNYHLHEPKIHFPIKICKYMINFSFRWIESLSYQLFLF